LMFSTVMMLPFTCGARVGTQRTVITFIKLARRPDREV
jgi:hypothetical protein